MTQKTTNPLSRVERRKTNYPLVTAAILVFGLLIAGAFVSIRDEHWTAAILFIAAVLVLIFAVLFEITHSRRLAALDDRKFIRWDAALPEVQRQTVNLEVRELARLLGVGGESLTDLLTVYVVAEDLALRQIQQEDNLPLMRHVSIGQVPFDGIIVDRDTITCVEVAFLVVPDIRQEKIEAMLRKIARAKENLAREKCRLRLKLMLVLVTQLEPEAEEQLRGMLTTRRFSETPVDVDIRMLDFEMLQRVYVSE